MAQEGPIRVFGLIELLKACAEGEKDTNRYVKETARKVGDIVKVDADRRVVHKHAKSAAGYRTYVRQRGVSVEQSLRKTTGLHPEWGAWQMRHGLIPALHDNQERLNVETEKAIGLIEARFEAA